MPVYTQIDFIVCRIRSKVILQDARAYAGATLSSDHKIVMAKLDLCSPYKIFKQRSSHTMYDISHLTCNRDTQDKYQSALNVNLSKSDISSLNNPTTKLNSLLNTVTTTAADIVGTRKPQQKSNYTSDSVVVELSDKRKFLRLQLNSNVSSDRSAIRTEINRTQKAIQYRLREIKSQAAENLANTIALTNEARRMFEAVRSLNKVNPSRPITVHNSEGHDIISDTDKADAIKSWFETQFTGNEPPLSPFSGPGRPLNTPITTAEVQCAIKKLT